MEWLVSKVKESEIEELANSNGRILSDEEVVNALIQKQINEFKQNNQHNEQMLWYSYRHKK